LTFYSQSQVVMATRQSMYSHILGLKSRSALSKVGSTKGREFATWHVEITVTADRTRYVPKFPKKAAGFSEMSTHTHTHSLTHSHSYTHTHTLTRIPTSPQHAISQTNATFIATVSLPASPVLSPCTVCHFPRTVTLIQTVLRSAITLLSVISEH
jgi:hypothetical protein